MAESSAALFIETSSRSETIPKQDGDGRKNRSCLCKAEEERDQIEGLIRSSKKKDRIGSYGKRSYTEEGVNMLSGSPS